MSTKKRPGVEAGIQLAAQPGNVKLWLGAETKLKDLAVPNLHSLAKELATISEKETMTKGDLDTIVSWKFAVGKPRPSIRKLLQSNSDQHVEQHTRAAISMAKTMNHQDNEHEFQQALAELEQLKGIGPATASAVLALVNPAVFCFMYDEVIDCFMPKRDYKRATYLDVRSKCQCIAHSLNEASSSSAWTPARVATVLWTECRHFALHGATPNENNGNDDDDHSEAKPPSSRRARQLKESSTVSKRRKL